MDKKLIVLVTNSDRDWGVLAGSEIWPWEDVVYICCDSKEISVKPIIKSERLMCIVKMKERAGNTENIRDVLSACHDYDTVVGTHTQNIEAEAVLDISKFEGIICNNYSTGREEYDFVYHWCEALIQPTSESTEIRDNFEKLFKMLRKSSIQQIHRKIYEILAAFLPLHLELQLKDQDRIQDLAKKLKREELALHFEVKGIPTEIKERPLACLGNFFTNFIEPLQGHKDIDFNQFHVTYCQMRDSMLSLLEGVESVNT